jgi:tetratricopeptide (TPR) repeat protein
MAKVPLRKYNSEIEALIDRGQTDEAIAHCRHILKTFPKHLETYRLLGKAYLETKRYAEATDIFKRVLMAVPEDFVSHVGMSIIADDQKRLDDAIWHMERAFESQPSNAAIQSEMQRLYGRRDGREPPKIRLTRGALAHMYVQGELYTQAIGEIRSVLAEEPNRTDMQVLLALAYFRGGHKVEASETCSQLIGRFPYCLDANRVLMEILPGTGLAESIQTYRQRVVELDPYAAYTPGSIFLANETQDSAVNLDRLEYKGQSVEASTEWGDALGTSLGAAGAAPAAKTEPTPASSQSLDFASRGTSVWQDKPFDLPKGEAVAQEKPFETPRAGPVPAASAPDGNAIPEWMRDAGWGASTGTFDESALSFDKETVADDLPKADLPDWIKSMAPSETNAPSKPTPDSTASDDTMDWLNKLNGDKPFDLPKGAAVAQDKPLAEQPQEPPVVAADIPDWFSDLGNDKPLDTTAQDVPAAASDEVADWLSKLDDDQPFDSASRSTPVGQDKFFAKPAQEIPPVVEPPIEPTATLASLGSSIGDLGTSAADQDAAMLWLEGLAAKQGAKSEELITNPEERLEKPPECLNPPRLCLKPHLPILTSWLNGSPNWMRRTSTSTSPKRTLSLKTCPSTLFCGAPPWSRTILPPYLLMVENRCATMHSTSVLSPSPSPNPHKRLRPLSCRLLNPRPRLPASALPLATSAPLRLTRIRACSGSKAWRPNKVRSPKN